MTALRSFYATEGLVNIVMCDIESNSPPLCIADAAVATRSAGSDQDGTKLTKTQKKNQKRRQAKKKQLAAQAQTTTSPSDATPGPSVDTGTEGTTSTEPSAPATTGPDTEESPDANTDAAPVVSAPDDVGEDPGAGESPEPLVCAPMPPKVRQAQKLMSVAKIADLGNACWVSLSCPGVFRMCVCVLAVQSVSNPRNQPWV